MLKALDGLRPWAVLGTRVMFGVIFMVHGGQKLFGWWGGRGIEGAIGAAHNVGFPEAIAPLFGWALAVTEFCGGVCMILGCMTRFWALGLVTVMAFAVFRAHWANGFFNGNRGFEYPLLLLVIAFSFFLAGAGPYSIDAGFRPQRK